MIVQAFLRWAETARASDRARAARALAKAYLQSNEGAEEHRAAVMAMTYLLDDPSPKVRLALAEALAAEGGAPRAVVMALAEDQPEIACTVIASSPVLRDADLVELVGRGDSFTRGLVAARQGLGASSCAAIAEVGDAGEIILLLENSSASISRVSLKRMAERFGHVAGVRHLLLEREGLTADARHMLAGHVAEALATSDLVRNTIGRNRIDVLTREAWAEAAVAIAGSVSHDEIPTLVEHLRASGRLTPALLVHALCSGKVDFFAAAIVALVNLDENRVRAILATGRTHAVRALFEDGPHPILVEIDENRVRAILATGRTHAVRALFEAAGIGRDIAPVFVEAVFLWRKAAAGGALDACYLGLLERFGDERDDGGPVGELIEMVDLLHRGEMRRHARSYAGDIALVA